MALVDHKKLSDMVQESWIIDSLKMYKTPDEDEVEVYRGKHEKTREWN